MTITIEINDEYVASIEQFLMGQLRQKKDEATGVTVLERIHPTVEAFLRDHLTNLVGQLVEQFPTPEVRKRLAAIKTLKDEIAGLTKPVVRATSTPGQPPA